MNTVNCFKGGVMSSFRGGLGSGGRRSPKRTRICGNVIKFMLFAVPGVLVLPQATGAENMFGNGGFERATTFRSNEVDRSYDKLVERNVVFPQGSDPMPEFVVINPNEGWPDDHASFDYLRGTPGAEVHSGSRAIHVISPKTFSGIMLGPVMPVADQPTSAVRSVQVGKECKYSFYAKGKGVVRIRFYMFESMGYLKNLYDYKLLQAVEPESHTVKNPGEWKQYTGTVIINSNAVGAVRLSVSFKGEVSMDDFQISN